MAPNYQDALAVGETEDFNDRLNVNLANHHRCDCITLREGATKRLLPDCLRG